MPPVRSARRSATDLRVAEIDLGVAKRRLCLKHPGAGDAGGGLPLIDRGFGDVVALQQVPAAAELDFGVGDLRLRPGDLRLPLGKLRLIGFLFDQEERIARLDHLPLGEQPLPQKSLYACPDIHFIDRDDPADETVIGGHRFPVDGCYSDSRRRRLWRRTGSSFLAVVARPERQQSEDSMRQRSAKI